VADDFAPLASGEDLGGHNPGGTENALCQASEIIGFFRGSVRTKAIRSSYSVLFGRAGALGPSRLESGRFTFATLERAVPLLPGVAFNLPPATKTNHRLIAAQRELMFWNE
jgi:hypothetical protein